MVSDLKGISMEDRSQLAERILDQVAGAFIYANRSGEIIPWNRASAASFGFSAEETLGQSLDLIIPEHLGASHWSGFNAAMTSGVMRLQGRLTLTRAPHESGRKLYVEMTFGIVMADEGEVLGSVVVARNVTDRVERERAAIRVLRRSRISFPITPAIRRHYLLLNFSPFDFDQMTVVPGTQFQ
jgi:PAS domain S-box-containing protein